MKLKRITRCLSWGAGLALSLATVGIGSQTATNVPAVALQSATVTLQLTPATVTGAEAGTATNTAESVAQPATPTARKATDLPAAIRTMNFDRGSGALLELVSAQQAGGKLSEVERFQLAVMLGDWVYVGEALKTLPEKDGMAAYTRLLGSLAGNSQSAAQFFQPGSPGNVPQPQQFDDMGNPIPPPAPPKQAEGKRGLFLSEDFYAVVDAAPGKLETTHIQNLAALVKLAIGPGGKQVFLGRLEKGLKGIGGPDDAGHTLAAQLLSAVGWMTDCGPYLPLKREQWDQADTFILVLTLEYFTQTGVQQKDERQLKRAAELCAFMMQTSRFTSNDRGLFRQATDRFVQLLPALEPNEAADLIRENFLTQPEILAELVLALGQAGQQAQKGTEMPLRKQSLATQNICLQVLAAKKSALPEAVNVLVVNWLGEAELSYKAGGAAAAGIMADNMNPFLVYRTASSYGRQAARSLGADEVLAVAPPGSLVRRLNQGLAQRVNLTLLKLNLLNPKEPTMETLAAYLKDHPGQEKEFCQEYLAAWVRKRTVPAEDPNIIRMRNLGYTIQRQQASGIPLTRLRQNQNVAEFKKLLASLRELSPEPLDAAAIIQSFMAIHSGAEVYKLEDIENIFGQPEKMNREELMGLITGMRTKLREQWQDPKTQQEAGTNRSEQETKDEVSRGYRTALELARRGLTPENAQWKEFIVRGQLFFDAAEYEFGRQIKLSEYVNLRDEAFGSYKKASEVYAARIPELPKGQWTMEPYQMWFFVMLGASDLSQLTRVAARSDPGLKQIGEAMRALPGEAAEAHASLFGQMLGTLLPQVPPNMRQRFLGAGLQVVGADHPSARSAVEALRNYQELLDEIQLRLTVDGSGTVGHARPFGVYVGVEHTRQLAREAGGFGKYLQNLSANQRNMMMGMPAGQKPMDYRDEFSKNIHAALDETFEIQSITFHDADVRPIDLPREGWQETPLAYIVLRAKDAAVDRIPSIQLDMDFADTSGQVVLPVRSQVEPIDAKDAEPVARPCPNLAIAMTMDEREWPQGRVVVEVAAKAQGVIPSHQEFLGYARDGFNVEVTDNGLTVGQFISDSRSKSVQADRNWTFTYTRKKDLRGTVLFPFPAIKSGTQATNVDYKHYQDADLVPIDAKRALAGVALNQGMQTGLRNVLITLVGLGLVAASWYAFRRRKGPHTAEGPALALPSRLTPFTAVAFLRRVDREHAARLDSASRATLIGQIREIEAACFSPAAGNGGPDLEGIARHWLQVVNSGRG